MTHERSGVCREQTPKPTLMVGKKIYSQTFCLRCKLELEKIATTQRAPLFCSDSAGERAWFFAGVKERIRGMRRNFRKGFLRAEQITGCVLLFVFFFLRSAQKGRNSTPVILVTVFVLYLIARE